MPRPLWKGLYRDQQKRHGVMQVTNAKGFFFLQKAIFKVK